MEYFVIAIIIILILVATYFMKASNRSAEDQYNSNKQIEILKSKILECETNKVKEITELNNVMNYHKNRCSEIQKMLDETKKAYNELKNREYTQDNWLEKQKSIQADLVTDLEDILIEREKVYKWVAPLIADIKMILMERLRDPSQLVTSKRSIETMARVDNLIREKKSLLEENAVLKYQLEYIKTLIPEIDDIVEYDESLNEAMEDDNPKNFLSKEEYEKLSDTEKNIRAFDFYKKRKKRNWEIGRDFERYIGYQFEKEGYEVEYFGIEMKYNDLGRDLIVKEKELTTIIQCKYWSKNKIIHEKHIAQLFGTVTKYKIDNPNEKVIGLFVSHTTLSDEAKNFANALDIHVMENVELGEYPLIKCNNGRDKDGDETKIYHLPMDQQYDAVKIEKNKGEFYAFTIEEAEEKGYRRAYKWHGAT